MPLLAFVLPFVERWAARALEAILVSLIANQATKLGHSAKHYVSGADWPWWLKSLAETAVDLFIDETSTVEDAELIAKRVMRSWQGQNIARQVANSDDISHAAKDPQFLKELLLTRIPGGMTLRDWLGKISDITKLDYDALLSIREGMLAMISELGG